MSEKSKFILAGDIGGTKTNIGVFMLKEDRLVPVKVLSFVNADYRGIEDIISDSLSHEEDAKFRDSIAAASFGVAGPVEHNTSTLTNLGWEIDGSTIGERFKIKEVVLMNDLVATGWGLNLLDLDKDIFVLQEGDKREGNSAMISAGTGLGETILCWNGTVNVPFPSEGGHADFAPKSAIEIELLEGLIEKYGRASYERVLSGSGLVNIYEFIRDKRGIVESEELKKRFASEDSAQVIAGEAQSGGLEACREALDIFVSVYASEAGNLALRALSVNGIYIGGGIAPKIIEDLKTGAFMEAFRKKGRFTEFMSKVPVYVILNEAAPLMGAAGRAAAIVRQAG
ncbi:MAG: glucokinase [Thermodesulfobacteriota bacterium]